MKSNNIKVVLPASSASSLLTSLPPTTLGLIHVESASRTSRLTEKNGKLALSINFTSFPVCAVYPQCCYGWLRLVTRLTEHCYTGQAWLGAWLLTTTASNKNSRRFHNHGEGPSLGWKCLLALSHYLRYFAKVNRRLNTVSRHEIGTATQRP